MKSEAVGWLLCILIIALAAAVMFVPADFWVRWLG